MLGSFPRFPASFTLRTSASSAPGSSPTPPAQHEASTQAESSSRNAAPSKPSSFQKLLNLAWGKSNKKTSESEGFFARIDGNVVWRQGKPEATKFRLTGDSITAAEGKHAVYEATPKPISPKELNTIPETVEHLHIQGSPQLSLENLERIGQMKNLKTLEFSSCKFPSSWSSEMFKELKQLKYLSFYNPNGFKFTDNLQGIAQLPSLKALSLSRCDFVNNRESYNTLGSMLNLTHLKLDRTITKEKAPGDATLVQVDNPPRFIRNVTNLDPSVAHALMNLIQNGSLEHVSLPWCSAIPEELMERLKKEAAPMNCQIITNY